MSYDETMALRVERTAFVPQCSMVGGPRLKVFLCNAVGDWKGLRGLQTHPLTDDVKNCDGEVGVEFLDCRTMQGCVESMRSRWCLGNRLRDWLLPRPSSLGIRQGWRSRVTPVSLEQTVRQFQFSGLWAPCHSLSFAFWSTKQRLWALTLLSFSGISWAYSPISLRCWGWPFAPWVRMNTSSSCLQSKSDL